MLAGFILAQYGILFAVAAVVYRRELFVHMTLHGWVLFLASLLLAIPGVVLLWVSGVSSYPLLGFEAPVYHLAWRITSTTCAIIILQAVGMLFDSVEFMCAAMVTCGSGCMLLGDTLNLVTLAYRSGGYDSADRTRALAGGILCAISTVFSIASLLRYFAQTNLCLAYRGYVLLSSPETINTLQPHPHIDASLVGARSDGWFARWSRGSQVGPLSPSEAPQSPSLKESPL
jgi:hypothetical protein